MKKARQLVLEDTTLKNVVHSSRIRLNTLFYHGQNKEEKSMRKSKFSLIYVFVKKRRKETVNQLYEKKI